MTTAAEIMSDSKLLTTRARPDEIERLDFLVKAEDSTFKGVAGNAIRALYRDFRRNSSLVFHPHPSVENKVQFKADPADYKKVCEIAEKRQLTHANVIYTALIRYLQRGSNYDEDTEQ